MTSFTGTLLLARLAVRRDLVSLLAWSVLIAVVLTGTVSAMDATYPSAAQRAGYALSMSDAPVQHFFNGPGEALGTLGGIVVFEFGGYLLVVVAVLSIMTVVRHSRAEEANGGAELIGAGCTGRYALGASALLVAMGTALWWAVVAAMTLGTAGTGWAGAVAYGSSLALSGTIFAVLTAVTCQLAEQPRTAALLASLVLLFSFVVRGWGDMRDSAIRWASPLAWAQATRPFGQVRWWPLVVAGVFVLVCVSFAMLLNNRRDIGAGWWRPRPGSTTASRYLASPLGIVLSQQRASIAGWCTAIGLLGIVFGLVTTEFAAAEGQIDVEAFAPGELDPVLALTTFATKVLAILATSAGIGLLRVPVVEQQTGRLDALLASSLGRIRWLGCQIAGAMGGASLALLLGGSGLMVGTAIAGVDSNPMDMVRLAVSYLPATWLLTSLAAMLFGVLPRWQPAAWLLVIHAVLAGVFGVMLRLPDWLIDLSPFSNVPQIPQESLVDAGLGIMVAVAALLLGAGLAGFRQRDIVC
ncbi:hypothetical protein VR010_02855 [Actinomycetaceae bacterium L2_0104]